MGGTRPGARDPQPDAPDEGPFRHALEALPRTPLADGRTLIEHTVVGDITFWWFFDIEYRNAVRRLATHGRTGLGADTGRLHGAVRRSPAMPWLYLLLAADARRRARKIVCDAPTRMPVGGTSCDVLLTAQNRMWKSFRGPGDEATAEPEDRLQDVFWDPMVRGLHAVGVDGLWSTYPTQGTGWPWPGGEGERIAREKMRIPHGLHHAPTDLFWDRDVWRDEPRHRRLLARRWRRLMDDPVLIRTLEAHGASGVALREELRYAFTVLMPRMASLVALMDRAVSAIRPRLVATLNEYGRLERALTYAARRHGVPVVAIQHGVVHSDHPGYMFAPGEVAEDAASTPPHVPIPDETLVYGDYHKDLLCSVGYPAEAVTVTGHPRSDLLHAAPRIYDRVAILRAYGLDPKVPTMVWTTQTHSLPSEENEAYRDAVAAMLDVTEDRVQLILKLHPSEDPTASFYGDTFDLVPDRHTTDEDATGEAAARTGADLVARSATRPVAVAGADADIFGILYAGDLLLTKNSTTAMEAVALDKPVVVLNLSGEPDLVDYVDEGVALGAYDADDLAPTVLGLLENDAPLAAHRAAYVARYLHNVDGHAVHRITDRIRTRMGT